MTPSLRSKNGTNVRTKTWGLRLLRAGIRVASRAATPLGTRVALELFLRPRRFPRPVWESRLLAHADVRTVPRHGDLNFTGGVGQHRLRAQQVAKGAGEVL